jgi:hypothetical protein
MNDLGYSAGARSSKNGTARPQRTGKDPQGNRVAKGRMGAVGRGSRDKERAREKHC